MKELTKRASFIDVAEVDEIDRCEIKAERTFTIILKVHIDHLTSTQTMINF